jgi:hypothetical protein
MPSAEHLLQARQEPDTGIVVYDDADSDIAIVTGSRRDSPPTAFSEYADPFLNPVFVTLAAIPFEAEEGG